MYLYKDMKEEFMDDLQINCHEKRICKPCQKCCPKKCKELLGEKQMRDHCKPCHSHCCKKKRNAVISIIRNAVTSIIRNAV
ncbi:hypothetical protein, partial [Metabacillus fastidiosus]|uniref:hypothetical protein n=1 Tax=Metabacillus fastidiosus TaxID=1458 RepID=UPI003D26DA5B